MNKGNLRKLRNICLIIWLIGVIFTLTSINPFNMTIPEGEQISFATILFIRFLNALFLSLPLLGFLCSLIFFSSVINLVISSAITLAIVFEVIIEEWQPCSECAKFCFWRFRGNLCYNCWLKNREVPDMIIPNIVPRLIRKEVSFEEKEFVCSHCGSRRFEERNGKKVCLHCGAERYERIDKVRTIYY